MIPYTKSFWDIPMLTRMYGSALPRAVPFAIFSAGLTLIYEFGGSQSTHEGWFSDVRIHSGDLTVPPARNPTPYPFQVFAFVVGFALVFRSTFAYRRYWEGRTQLQVMTALFTETVMQVLNFDRGTLPEKLTQKQKEKYERFGETFVHYMSLLHAIAIQSLRKDWDLTNLTKHDQSANPPPIDPKELLGRLRTRFPSFKHLPSWKRTQTKKEEEPSEEKRLGLIGTLKNFHAGFRLTDFMVVRSSRRDRLTYNKMMPLPVVGGISEDEKVGLGSKVIYEPRTGISKGCVLSNGTVVPGPGERVSVVAMWVNQIILDRRREGGLAIEPPIMTRVYGILSNGLLGYEQCRKLVDTPFPFSWAQLITVVLVVFVVMLPLVTAAAIHQWAVAMTVSFISVLTHVGLNELARDLEDPFVYDPNDLPVARQQWIFNERILALSRTKRPLTTVETGNARMRTSAALNIGMEKSRIDMGARLRVTPQQRRNRIGGISTVHEDVIGIDEQVMYPHHDHKLSAVSGNGGLGTVIEDVLELQNKDEPEQTDGGHIQQHSVGSARDLQVDDIYHVTVPDDVQQEPSDVVAPKEEPAEQPTFVLKRRK